MKKEVTKVLLIIVCVYYVSILSYNLKRQSIDLELRLQNYADVVPVLAFTCEVSFSLPIMPANLLSTYITCQFPR